MNSVPQDSPGMDKEVPSDLYAGDTFSEVKQQRLQINTSHLWEDLALERSRFQSRPLFLEFSTNNKCNLQCVMCSPKKRRSSSLPPHLVKSVLLEELLPDALCLLPSSGSEPFLGDLDILGEGCVKHEVQLNIITNGTLITKSRLEAIEPAIGRLQISFDGHTKELYESIRRGARFERVLENVKTAAEIARRKEFVILLSAVFTTALARELDAYVRFAAEIGVDAVAFQNMHHLTRAAVEMDAFRALDEFEISAATDKAIAVAKQGGLDIYFDFNPAFGKSFNTRPHRTYYADNLQQALVRDFPGICFMAATYVRVDPKGHVYPCCVPSRKLRMGNINRASFQSIWNGRAYQHLRKSMLTGRPPKPCRTCKHLQRGLWET